MLLARCAALRTGPRRVSPECRLTFTRSGADGWVMDGTVAMWAAVLQFLAAGLVGGFCVLEWLWWRGELRVAGAAWTLAWSGIVALGFAASGTLALTPAGPARAGLAFAVALLAAGTILVALPATRAYTSGPRVRWYVLVAGAVLTLNRYPDREFTALREGLAGYLGHGLTAEQVWAANGSNEIIQQLLQAFGGPGRSVLAFPPTYSMHGIITRGTGTTWLTAERDPEYRLSAETVVAAIEAHRPDIVFLCAPNNPTGTPVALEVIEAAYEASVGIVFVDEAYAEFMPADAPSAITRRGQGSAPRESPAQASARSSVTRTKIVSIAPARTFASHGKASRDEACRYQGAAPQ